MVLSKKVMSSISVIWDFQKNKKKKKNNHKKGVKNRKKRRKPLKSLRFSHVI